MKGADTKVSALDRKCMTDYQYLRKQSHFAEFGTTKNECTTINAMWKWGYNEGFTHFKKFDFKKIVIKNTDIGRRDTFTDKEYDKLVRFMRNWTSVKQCNSYAKVRDKGGKWSKGELRFDEKLQLERQMVRDYILISANTGLRVGEARQLTWGDVERIEEHIIDEATEEKQLLVKLKVRWETSKVRLPREFLSRGGEYFVRLRERQQFTEPHHLVFSMNGKSTLREKWSKHWISLMEGAGIKDWKKELLKDENGNWILDDEGYPQTIGRNLTYYSLRHYQISSRVKSNVPLIDISKQVGTSVGHIEKTYLHYEEEQSRTNALKTYTKIDGIITPTDNIKKKKERNSNEYGSQELRLSSRHLH
jgi:integrase